MDPLPAGSRDEEVNMAIKSTTQRQRQNTGTVTLVPGKMAICYDLALCLYQFTETLMNMRSCLLGSDGVSDQSSTDLF